MRSRRSYSNSGLIKCTHTHTHTQNDVNQCIFSLGNVGLLAHSFVNVKLGRDIFNEHSLSDLSFLNNNFKEL